MDGDAAAAERQHGDRGDRKVLRPAIRSGDLSTDSQCLSRFGDPPSADHAFSAPKTKGRRLRWHLLGFAAALLLPMLAFAVMVAFEYGEARRARLEGEARAVARDLGATVDRELSALLAAAQTLAASPALREDDLGAFERQAFEVATARAVVIVVRAPSGRQLVNTAAARGAPLPQRTDEGENEEAWRATTAGAFYISNLFEGRLTRRPYLRVVVPARVPEEGATTPPGRPFGQVDMAFPPENLRRLLADRDLPAGWIAGIIDRTGSIVARSHRHDEFAGKPATRSVQDNTTGHGGVFRATRVDGVDALGAYARTTLGGLRVVVGVPLSVLEAPLRTSLWWLAGLGLIFTGLAAALALALARRMEASVGALAAAAADFGAGRHAPFPATPVWEVNEVGAALAAAGAELRSRIASERAARLEARRELLQAVIDGTSDPILARDLDGRFVLANRAGADLLGVRSPADVLGRRFADLLPGGQAEIASALDRSVVAAGEARAVEHCVDAAAAGSAGRRFFVTTKSPWRDADGRIAGVVCVSRDVTAKRAAEERLETVRAELLRASRLGAVGAMAAGLAHELNQPLGAAANFLAAAEALLGCGMEDLAAPEAARSPAPALYGGCEAVAEAGRQVLRAGEIVRRLRDFIAHGDADMRVEEIGQLVAEACAVALPFCGSAGSAVALRVQSDANAGSVLVDRVQVQQVIINLVRNAAQALAGDGDEPTAGGEILVSVRHAAGGGCEVAVADTGPGIAPEVRDRLFEPLASTKPGGMGVGLAICRAIVEAHGGRLWAEPNAGGGAVFRFALPPPLTPTKGQDDDGSA